LFMDQVDLMDLMDKMGAPRDNPRVGGAQFGVARVEMCRWVARAVWQRWCAGCGGAALVYGPGGPDGPNGQDGRATVYPGGLHAAVWFGAGDDMPPGYAGNVMATAVCETAGV